MCVKKRSHLGKHCSPPENIPSVRFIVQTAYIYPQHIDDINRQ